MNCRRFNLFVALGLGSLIMSACVFDQLKEYKKVEVNPHDAMPESSFVVEVRAASTTEDNDSDKMCIEISQETLWKPGDQTSELTGFIANNTIISLDNEIVPESTISKWVITTDNLVTQNGEVLGSYGGNIIFCVNTGQLSNGAHSATIEIKSTDGMNHSYRWSFQVLLMLTPLPSSTP